MPEVSIGNTRVLEGDSGTTYATIRVSLDSAATVPVTLSYFTMDETASAGQGDYYARWNQTVTIAAGATYADVNISVRGGTVSEGDEAFQVVFTPHTNASFANGAAALISTVTILDDDDGIPSATPGRYGAATPVFGPTAEPGLRPTMTVHDATIVEADSSWEYNTFLVTLDRPATADVTVDYYVQSGSASEQSGDLYDTSGTLTIRAGRQSGYIGVSVRGDLAIEGDETFQLVLTDVSNAVFEDGAAALAATGTILGDDGGAVSGAGGIGAPGEVIAGPDSAGSLPTLRVSDVAMLEGDSGSEYARVLITLDRPATAPISISYYTQDGSASAASGDYYDRTNSFTIPAGTQSTYVSITVRGDQVLDGDEDFSVVFTDLSNAVFENGAASLVSTVTIIEDDIGAPTASGGIGAPGEAIYGPDATTPLIPVVEVHDVTVIEGDSGSEYARFLVTLDRPAVSDVTLYYSTMDGSASEAQGDYSDADGSVTIRAGEQSTWVSRTVYGDTAIEGDEYFDLFFYRVDNAVFRGNVPAMVARATIIDNDGGLLSRDGAIDDPAAGALGPDPNPDAIMIRVADTTVIEGDGYSDYHAIPILLSEAARTDITITWETLDLGSATGDTDFDLRSGSLTIAAGRTASVMSVIVYGDTAIEGNETFGLSVRASGGAVFEGNTSEVVTQITIIDDEVSGTPGTGADLSLTHGTTEGADRLLGSQLADVIDGDGGDDTIFALAGDDTLDGGTGNNEMHGGEGFDRLIGGAGQDTLHGDDGGDTLIGGSGDDMLIGGVSEADLRDVIYGGDGDDYILGGYGNDELNAGNDDDTVGGGFGADTIFGFDGNDVLTGEAWSDLIYGGAGNDFVNGGFGYDRVNGGTGADRFYHLGVRDHGSDWIQDYDSAEGDVLVFGRSATVDQFQVNFAETAGAGAAGVAEAFIVYRPTGQVVWALIDGGGQSSIDLALEGVTYDLLL